jgi:hypothetical protein
MRALRFGASPLMASHVFAPGPDPSIIPTLPREQYQSNNQQKSYHEANERITSGISLSSI